MVGTALIMIGPGLSRTLNEYGGAGITAYTATIALSLKTVLAAALLGKDLLSKKSWIPYTVVLMALLLSDLVYYARYSVVWQGFGKFVINNLY